MSRALDKRAARILHDAYWAAGQWRARGEPVVSADDFAYARSQGVMFDPVHMDHAEIVARVHGCIAALDRRTVVDAFLASLSTRRLDWRSALASFAVFQHFPEHAALPAEAYCAICGHYGSGKAQDFNVLNFERMKWGGVRHTDPVYASLDLRLFLNDPAPPPSSADVDVFRRLIDTIRRVGPGTTAAALQSSLSPHLKSNKAERDRIIGTLGICDVLAGPSHPGFSDTFTPFYARRLPGHHFVEMSYPACWWRGSMGINEPRLEEYFGHVL